jgi:hypothetical protein
LPEEKIPKEHKDLIAKYTEGASLDELNDGAEKLGFESVWKIPRISEMLREQFTELFKRGWFTNVSGLLFHANRNGVDVNMKGLDKEWREGMERKIVNWSYGSHLYLIKEGIELKKKYDLSVNLEDIENFDEKVREGICNRIKNGSPHHAIELLEWLKEQEKEIDLNKTDKIKNAIHEWLASPKREQEILFGGKLQNLVRLIDTHNVDVHEKDLPVINERREKMKEFRVL